MWLGRVGRRRGVMGAQRLSILLSCPPNGCPLAVMHIGATLLWEVVCAVPGTGFMPVFLKLSSKYWSSGPSPGKYLASWHMLREEGAVSILLPCQSPGSVRTSIFSSVFLPMLCLPGIFYIVYAFVVHVQSEKDMTKQELCVRSCFWQQKCFPLASRSPGHAWPLVSQQAQLSEIRHRGADREILSDNGSLGTGVQDTLCCGSQMWMADGYVKKVGLLLFLTIAVWCNCMKALGLCSPCMQRTHR